MFQLLLVLACVSAGQHEIREALQPNFLEVEQACPAGTSLQSIPQLQSSLPSNAQNLPRSSSFSSCGTSQSNCSFCAPSGSYLTSPGSFVISARCTSVTKNNVHASYSSNVAGLALTFGAYPAWDLTVTVSASVVGYVLYEVCDSFNNYGSWVAPVGQVTVPTTPTPSAPAACPAGTSLQTIPQSQSSLPSNAQNVPRSSSFSCGTGQSNCSFCAPSGSYLTSPGSFVISARCTSATKNNVHASYSVTNVAGLALTFGAYPAWDLTVTVNTPMVGYVLYEVCDSFNNYASWVAPVGKVTAPTPTPSVAPPQSNCNNKLPQSTTLPATYPTWLQNPFTQAPKVTCGTVTSTLTVCAPSSPLVSGTYAISASTSPQASYASWAGAGTPKVTGTYQGLTYNFTLTKSTGDAGYIKYEFCDWSNNYGSWVLFF